MADTNQNPVNKNTNSPAPKINSGKAQNQQSGKSSLASLLKRGISQFNPVPREQKFTPPPTAAVPNVPLPTQPFVPPDTKTQNSPAKSTLSPKTLLLIPATIIFCLIILSYTLYYTRYTVFSPPTPIKNLIENTFSKIPYVSLDEYKLESQRPEDTTFEPADEIPEEEPQTEELE